MGSKLCTLLHPKPQSAEAEPCGRRSSSSSSLMSKCFMNGRRRRRRCIENYNETQNEENSKVIKARKLTLEDWLQSSPSGVKPDYLKRGEFCSFKNSRKKVHPSSSASIQVHSRLISEAKDSLCLDRPINEEEEGKSEFLSSSVSIGKAEKKKKVSFKLPHHVIMYSPEEEEDDCFYSPLMDEGNDKGGTFEAHDEEICFRLAGNTLPHVSVPSTVL